MPSSFSGNMKGKETSISRPIVSFCPAGSSFRLLLGLDRTGSATRRGVAIVSVVIHLVCVSELNHG